MQLPLFLIPIVTALIAQALKPALNRKWYATLTPDGRRLPRYGGMPSAHSAFVFSMATVVALADGIYSSSFVIAATLMILVLDEALRMRIFLSRHGQALRRLIQKLPAGEQQAYPYLESRLGHKPLEVVAGAALGICISLFIYFISQ